MIPQPHVRFIATVVVTIVVVITTVTVILVTVDSTPSGVVAEEGSTSSSLWSLDHRRLKEQKPTTKSLSSVEPLVLNDFHKNRQRSNQYGRAYRSKSSLEVCTFTPPVKNNNQNKDLFVYQGGLSRDDDRRNNDDTNIEVSNDNQGSLISQLLGGPQGFIYVIYSL